MNSRVKLLGLDDPQIARYIEDLRPIYKFDIYFLEKLPTKRLIKVLRKVSAMRSFEYHHRGRRCCEMCHEYVGDNWDYDVGRYLEVFDRYIEQIKDILKTRENVRIKKVFR